jgi:glycosyltransferase involved in cell wall biosynthesis
MPLKITPTPWPEGTMPAVSICCITYNQEQYIGEAIEGFLLQETGFPVEILIHDDASTDRTAEIVREYQARYPNRIRLIAQTENQYSKGRRIAPIVIKEAIGKYIALCEGDDYWISPGKLESQVAILEQDETVALVFHNAWVKHDDSRLDYFINQNLPQERFTLDDIIERNWFIATASMVFRSDKFDYPGCLSFTKGGDMVIQMSSCLHGDAVFHNEVASVYRRHDGGVSHEFWQLGDFHFHTLLPNHIWTFWIFGARVADDRHAPAIQGRILTILERICDYRVRYGSEGEGISLEDMSELIFHDIRKEMPSERELQGASSDELERLLHLLGSHLKALHGKALNNQVISLAGAGNCRAAAALFAKIIFLGSVSIKELVRTAAILANRAGKKILARQ